METTVLLVDDHSKFRKGLCNLLEEEKDLQVVGEAGDGQEAINLVRKLSPDIVVMDITMPNLNGIDACQNIISESPHTKVIALSVHSGKRFVEDMLGAGAVGYLLKESAPEELVNAIRAVKKGEVRLSAAITGVVVSQYKFILSKAKVSGKYDELTKKENEILKLIVEGNSTKQIASIIKVSIDTVRSTQDRIMKKLEVKNVKDLRKVTLSGSMIEQVNQYIPAEEAKFSEIKRTKLHPPPLPLDFVIRSKLMKKISNSHNSPLFLISAPPGYGKSTLVSYWLKESKMPCAWISLDEEDNHLHIFLEYVLASVQKIFPDNLKKTSEIVKAAFLPPLNIIANILINDLDEIDKEFVLVLDDYHRILEKKIHDLLDAVLKYPPENMLLCIVTRRDPPLRINSLRVYNRLIELRMDDLAFNPTEIRMLYENILGLTVSAEISQKLLAKTEGWITGLRLVAHSAVTLEDLDNILKKMKGNLRLVTEYLIDEVFAKQPEDFQNYLITTSLFDRFCGELTEELYLPERGKAEKKVRGKEFIEWLENANLFIIPLDDEQIWFRYHHEFQNLLQKQLKKRRTEKQIKEIHIRAGKWFENNNLVGEAIQHTILAGDTARAQEIILGNWVEVFNRDDWYMVEGWMAILPEKFVVKSSSLLLIRAWIAQAKHNIAEIPAILEQIKLIDSNLTDAESGYLAFFQCMFCYSTGHGKKALILAHQAEQLIPKEHFSFRGDVGTYGACSMHMVGQGDSSIKKIKKNIQNLYPPGEPIQLSRLVGQQSIIHLLNANLPGIKTATEEFFRIENLSRNALAYRTYIRGSYCWWGNDPEGTVREFELVINHLNVSSARQSIDAFIAQALALQALNRSTDATGVMNRAIKFAEEKEDAGNLAVAHSGLARLSLLQGDLAAGENWLNTAEHSDLNNSLLWWIEIPAITRCRVLIAKGTSASLQEALELLNEYRVYVESIHNKLRTIEIVLLQAKANYKLKRKSNALKELKYALDLAANGDWVRPFIEAGSEIIDLLVLINKKVASSEFIDKILDEINKKEQRTSSTESEIQSSKNVQPSQDNLDSLSRRELEILKLVTQGLRNREIAEKIFLSPATIKKHIYNIYQKLDVHTRIEVVTKAKELNFVS